MTFPVRRVPDNERMVLLNVVCFGPEQKMVHKHVVSALDSGASPIRASSAWSGTTGPGRGCLSASP
jgi:hypothetical protein